MVLPIVQFSKKQYLCARYGLFRSKVCGAKRNKANREENAHTAHIAPKTILQPKINELNYM